MPFNPMPPDHELISAFTDPHYDLRFFVEHFGITLEQLEAWMLRPDIQQALDRVHRINAHRARFLAAQSLPQALQTLHHLAAADQIAGQTTRPETARKAASTIVRFAAAPPAKAPVPPLDGPPGPAQWCDPQQAAESVHPSRLDRLFPPGERLTARLASRAGSTPQLQHRRTRSTAMPKPSAWSDKDERQYEHIKDTYKGRGKDEDTAQEIAARTVNKERRDEGRTKDQHDDS